MSRRQKFKNTVRELTGEVKALFKRPDIQVGAAGSNTPAPIATKKGVKKFAAGLVESAADAVKLGPLRDIADMLQGFADKYQLEGTVKKEHEELHQRLQMLRKVVENHCDEGVSPAMASKIKEIRDFVEGELNSVAKNLSSGQHGRLLMAKDEEDRFIASCRRIQEYMERLSLDASLSTWKLEEQQSKDKMSSLISRLPSSPSAWYNSGTGAELKRGECTSGTRVEVLASLLSWATDDVSGVYWLNGMAGTGKTTIAYSVCQELDAKRNLAASFFCSRQLEECRDVKLIIPSIAYQLARFSPSFQSALSTVLEKDADICTKRLSMQFQALIHEPLLAAQAVLAEELVVVIDALDECENRDSTRDILELLLEKGDNLPIKFIVSSRPEPQIRDKMTDERVRSRLVLHELDKGEVQADIEKYLREGLAPMSPSDAQIIALVERAGILFIFAATAVRFIGYDNFRRNPTARLRTILDASHTNGSKKNDEIDQLYSIILEAALGDQSLEPGEREDMQQVLYTVICGREPLTVQGLSELLGVKDVERVRSALRPLWSVLHVVGVNELVKTLHASFPDFMFDSTRSNSYCCDSNAHHLKLSKHCLEYIVQTQPQFNICGLESSYISDELVPEIDERIVESISSGLLYACRYWVDHVKAASGASIVIDKLRDFLSTRLLLWMEVLNLTNQVKSGTECMKLIVEWCKAIEGEHELAELAHDAKRFVEAFASNPVSLSTPHIYVSMLAFWPKSGPIAQCYAKYLEGPVEVEGAALDRRQMAHLSTWAFDNRIEAMAVSPDGLCLAIAIGNDVLVVDSSGGEVVLGPLQGHSDKVRTVAFPPDGSRILSSSFYPDTSATILGWDTRTGDAVLGPLQLHGHIFGIKCLSFSPNCDWIATGSNDSAVRLWDAETGRILHQLEAQDSIHEVIFAFDNTQVAAGAGKVLYRWDSLTGESTRTPLTHTTYFKPIALSPDHSRIISRSENWRSICVWNALGGEMIQSMEGHTGYINCITYSHDGRYVVSGSDDQTVRMWDAQSGDMLLGPLEGHTQAITSVTFSPDDSRIISACEGGLVCTWDAQQRNITNISTSALLNYITCAKFSSDGAHFASGSTEGTIFIWDAHTGELVLGPVKVHTSRINGVDFKSNRIVSGSKDGNICVCDARTGEVVLGPLQVGSQIIFAIAYFPDGELIASGSSGGVDVWSAQDGSRKLGPLTDLNGDVLSVQFSPDGTHIVASSHGSTSNIAVWDVPDGTKVFSSLFGPGHSSPVSSIAYSPNGALIASGSEDHTIALWNAYTGKRAIRPLTGHSHWVLSVNFSPDSTHLVSCSDDRTIRIWGVQTGEMIFKLLHGHEGQITSVEYSPDGTCILSRSDDMSVRIHDARNPVERAQSCPESEVGDWTIKKDGWVVDDQSRLLVWVPGDLRKALMWPSTRIIVGPQGNVGLKFDKSRMGESWERSYASHI